ncbi:unnamed protein product [Peronospora destructor]|uniref:Uncharacterized protein n=1 Tax=Peronospora destructor TaxID=86335 RepID=A0AAV0VFP3_9STRA|nr:unnamed protein product [Peronospora destructor]
MNSLGLEYGSSSSDEEDAASPPKTQTQSVGYRQQRLHWVADNETQQRIERFLWVQHERGQDFQTTLQDKKEVRNPYILEKVVEYFRIDELQSNLSPHKFDPHGLPLHEYTDVLTMEQKKRADARAQRQLQQRRDGADPRQLQFISPNALS